MHGLKTTGGVYKSFIVKLSANWLTSDYCAVQHDSEYGVVYRQPAVFVSVVFPAGGAAMETRAS
jgi:hypothetical protein